MTISSIMFLILQAAGNGKERPFIRGIKIELFQQIHATNGKTEASRYGQRRVYAFFPILISLQRQGTIYPSDNQCPFFQVTFPIYLNSFQVLFSHHLKTFQAGTEDLSGTT